MGLVLVAYQDLFKLIILLPATSTEMPDSVIVPSDFISSLLLPTSNVMEGAALIFTAP